MNALRFPRLATFAWACALVAGLAPSAFGGIVYTMTNASGLQNGWELSGTITVSGAGTNLGRADITGWAYTVAKEGTGSYTYSSNGSNNGVNARGLLATSTQLILKYSSAQSFSTNNLRIFLSQGSGNLAWNIGGGLDNDISAYFANDFTGGGPSMSFWQQQDLTFPLTTTDGWVIGTVSPSAVPEIDPAGIGSVLALVTGALGLLERRRLKTA
jgi:hypothetical protein